MPDIVTLEEAKLWTRVTGTDEDATFAILIAAATEAVADMADQWDGTGEAPARLKLAVLHRVAMGFHDREVLTPAANEGRLIGPLHSITL